MVHKRNLTIPVRFREPLIRMASQSGTDIQSNGKGGCQIEKMCCVNALVIKFKLVLLLQLHSCSATIHSHHSDHCSATTQPS